MSKQVNLGDSSPRLGMTGLVEIIERGRGGEPDRICSIRFDTYPARRPFFTNLLNPLSSRTK